MLKVNFYNLNEIEDSLFKYAVIVASYNGKWIYCKNKIRGAWEIPGGRREKNENILDTAKRELFEETGAIEFNLKPICVYSVEGEKQEESHGLLCYATIEKLGKLPDSEIESIGFFDNIPENLSFPDIQPKLFEKVQAVKNLFYDSVE